MPTIAELIKKATGSNPDEMAQAVKTLEYLYGTTPMGKQDFGPDDSTIASTVAHPIKGAGKLAEWFRGNVNTAAGYSDPFDNPNPLLGPSMDKKAEAGLNLAGMLQTGAMPFAPKSAGGTLGTVNGYGGAEDIANQLNKSFGEKLDASITKGKDGQLTLDKLIVPKESRGQGIGSSFLEDLNNYADGDVSIIKLDAMGDFGGSKTRQNKLYKKYGFVDNKGKNKDFAISQNMYRSPKLKDMK